jgi:hypothetical protein
MFTRPLQRLSTLRAVRCLIAPLPIGTGTGQGRIFQHPRPQAIEPLIQRPFDFLERRPRML